MKKPTEEQLRDPKWWDENAPEWATSHGFVGDDLNPVWFDDERYRYANHPEREYPFSGAVVYEISEILNVTERPSPAWQGPQDGLPPVGAACEVFDVFEWLECSVVAHDGKYALAKYEEGVYGAGLAESFRPIRTPEQIAAQEREESIDKMVGVSPLLDKAWSRTVCAALYDAGYRKQEQSE